MEDAIETFEHNGFKIGVFTHDDPQNPRTEWDNLGKMVCFHRRYDLGDKHDVRHEDFSSWDEMEKHLINKEGAVVILPLYIYDHSGITMYTSGNTTYHQHAAWDSMQVGFIYISGKKAREEYSKKRISKKLKERIEKYLRGEIKTYDEYLRGDVYGYKVFDADENEIDACWGYYGDNHEENGLLDSARSAIDGHIKHEAEKTVEQN